MASAQILGNWKIGKFNQATEVFKPLITADAKKLGYKAPASRDNPQEQDQPVLFLEGGVAIDEKEILQIKYQPNAAAVAESEESEFSLDVTIVDKKTGTERTDTITFNNKLVGFTSAGAVDLTLPASQDTVIATYEIPTDQQVVLGRKDGRGKLYAYLGDNQ